MSSRPRAIALAVALALILVGTLTAWFVLVPRYVRRKATETLHARYGVEATIAEVSVGFRGAELRGVRGHDGVGGAIRFELERVALVGSPWALRAGPRAAERIEIGPGTVTVSSTEASLANLATRLRSGSPTSAGSSGATPRAQPVFAVRSLRLVVEDEHGVLGEAVLDDVASRGDAWALRASAARAGAAPGDRLVATGLDVAIVRQGRLRLQRVALASLEASWATRTSDDDLQASACLALGLIGESASIEPLRRVVAASRNRPIVLRDACIALGLLGDHELVPTLAAWLREAPNLGQLSATATALGWIGDQRAIEPLCAIVESSQAPDRVRAFAAVALGLLGEKDQLPWNAVYARDAVWWLAPATFYDPLNGSGIVDLL